MLFSNTLDNPANPPHLARRRSRKVLAPPLA